MMSYIKIATKALFEAFVSVMASAVVYSLLPEMGWVVIVGGVIALAVAIVAIHDIRVLRTAQRQMMAVMLSGNKEENE